MLVGRGKNYPSRLLVSHSSFFLIWTFLIHLCCWMPSTENLKPQIYTSCKGTWSFFFFALGAFFFFTFGSALLLWNWDNQLIPLRLYLINCKHLHSFDAIVNVDWTGKGWGFRFYERKELCGDLIALIVFSIIKRTSVCDLWSFNFLWICVYLLFFFSICSSEFWRKVLRQFTKTLKCTS
jgi:hypothetical protein